MTMPLRLFLLLLVAGARTALPCQCGHRPSALEAIPRSVVVFDGTVVRREPALTPWEDHLIPVDRFVFRVHKVWLGPGDERRDLLQGLTNCDSHFRVGARYLVFANRDWTPIALTSSICLPTQPIERAAASLAELGPGFGVSAPEPVPSETLGRVRVRHLHASFLAGLSLLREAFFFPAESIPRQWQYLLVSAVPCLLTIGWCAVCLWRRRFRALALSALPVTLLLAASLLLQGYLYLRTAPMMGLLIDFNPFGV